ncbi:ipis-1 [Penaeus vannamei]|uniref:ipis-1 n=1 Tax=Penaeus vannamei TaxID=6689 RepID=UPI00387F7A30
MKWLALALTLVTTTPTSVTAQCFSQNDRVITPSSSELSQLTRFAVALYKDMLARNTTGNYLVSPYSVWKALTLAYFGSSGNTQAELEGVLGAEDKISSLKVWSHLDRLYGTEQSSEDEGVVMEGRAYLSGRRSLRPCVEEILDDALRTLDFSNVYRAATDINQWTAQVTRGRAARLLQPNDLLGTNMVLASAAAFKGAWAAPFEVSSSRLQPFYATPEEPRDAVTMTQRGVFNYGESEDLGVQILELPYANSPVSLYVLLPPLSAGSRGLADTVERLSPPLLESALAAMTPAVVRVVMPKFKIESKDGDGLQETLSRLGVKDLFSERANLSVFSPEGNLRVGHAAHKAVMEVDEGGTDSSVSSSAKNFAVPPAGGRPSGEGGPLRNRVFVCNRPFAFLLRDTRAGRLLFMGALKDVPL